MPPKPSFNTLPDQVARHFYAKQQPFTMHDIKAELLPEKSNTQIQNVMTRLQNMPDAYKVKTDLVMMDGRMHRVLTIQEMYDQKAPPRHASEKLSAAMKLALGRSI